MPFFLSVHQNRLAEDFNSHFDWSSKKIIVGTFAVVVLVQTDALHCFMAFPLTVQRFSLGLNICNKYFPKKWLRVSCHFWGTSIVLQYQTLAKWHQPLCWCLQGWYILRVHSQASCPIGWQMPSSEPLSSWWVTSCQGRTSAWHQIPTQMWPWTNNVMAEVIYWCFSRISSPFPLSPFLSPNFGTLMIFERFHCMGMFFILFVFIFQFPWPHYFLYFYGILI